MKVRLTRKLAERIDGVDLADFRVGDVLDLPPAEARLVIAEQWADFAVPNVDPSAGESFHSYPPS